MKKVPDQDDEDPPEKSQTLWQIYTYKPPPKARGDYSYDGHAIANKMTAIDPQQVVNTKATVFGKGTNVKPIEAVVFLQKRPAHAGAKHRIRDIRSVQSERAFTNKVSLFPPGHMCNTKDGLSVLMRVSAPFNVEGDLLMKLAEDLIQTMSQSLSKVRAKVKAKRVKAKISQKDKGKGNFNPTFVHPDNLDPLKLVWKPRRRELVPVKGAGRDNYRALRSETLRDWLHKIEYQRVIEVGGDVESIQITLEDYALPDVNPVAKRAKGSSEATTRALRKILKRKE